MESQKTMEPSTFLDGVSKRSVDVSAWIASAVVIATLVLLVGNAALRTFSGFLVPGAFEMGMLAMPVLVFLALPWTFYEKRNYQLDVLYGLIRGRGQRYLDLLQTLLYLGITAMWTYGVVIETSRSVRDLEYAPGSVQLPVYPAKMAIAIGCVLILLVLFRELIQRIKLLKEPSIDTRARGVRSS